MFNIKFLDNLSGVEIANSSRDLTHDEQISNQTILSVSVYKQNSNIDNRKKN